MKKENNVPDHVLFGLILGEINGPFMLEPATQAVVSLMNDIAIIKQIRFLSIVNKIEIKISIFNTKNIKKISKYLFIYIENIINKKIIVDIKKQLFIQKLKI